MLFKKKNKTPDVVTPDVATPAKPQIAENHVSSKKKNTYVIKYPHFYDLSLFSLCKNTPMCIDTLNGKPFHPNDAWVQPLQFPNPCAADMVTKKDVLLEVMGNKISKTIIEYLDKDTNAPVCQVYPEMIHVFDEYDGDFKSHLNHASRRDLEHQINLRANLIQKFFAAQNQK